MATIDEGHESRGFTISRTSGRELIYRIRGTNDETEVQALLAATVPLIYLGLQIESYGAEPQGNGYWIGTARYVRLNENEFTFDTGGGTQHITQSLETVASYAAPGRTAPNFGGAINVTNDSIEGTDIPAPKYEFTETHYFEDATITEAYKLTLFNLTGRYNNATFRGLDIGECLLMGVSGSKRGDERWGLTFRFAGSPNVTGLAIGDITGIDKQGWDYLWVRYEEKEDSGARSLVKRPAAAYVERVVFPGDFTLLLIG